MGGTLPYSPVIPVRETGKIRQRQTCRLRNGSPGAEPNYSRLEFRISDISPQGGHGGVTRDRGAKGPVMGFLVFGQSSLATHALATMRNLVKVPNAFHAGGALALSEVSI